MLQKRDIISIGSITCLIIAGLAVALGKLKLGGTFIFSFYAISAVVFFAVLVSDQRYQEDQIAKIGRVLSAILLPYIIIIQLIYAPLARCYFGSLIQKSFFLSDLLALLLFMFFFFLFGTAALLLNSFSRFGLFPGWRILNSKKTYLISRIIFPTAILIVIFLFLLKPFLIISI